MALSFFRPRPSGASLARPSLAMAAPTSIAEAPERDGFEPIPFPPAGPLPYRLDLMEILGVEAVDRIRAAKSMTFHTIGDSGGVKSP